MRRNHSGNENKSRHRPQQEAHRSDTPVIRAWRIEAEESGIGKLEVSLDLKVFETCLKSNFFF